MIPFCFSINASYVFAGCQMHFLLIRLTTSWAQMIAKCKQRFVLEHDARVTVRYISLHCPLNKAWVIIGLSCASPHISQHGQLPKLSFVSSAVWAPVIWQLWEAALGVEYLTRPSGPGGIKCIKNAKTSTHPVVKLICTTGWGSLWISQRGLGWVFPFWHQGEINLSSSWPSCVTFAVNSVTRLL